jgi:hypothetical protein
MIAFGVSGWEIENQMAALISSMRVGMDCSVGNDRCGNASGSRAGKSWRVQGRAPFLKKLKD